MNELKQVLANVDLDSVDLDNIGDIQPQMKRVLDSVQKWSTDAVAHQNHNSHGDSSGGIERDKEWDDKLTLQHGK